MFRENPSVPWNQDHRRQEGHFPTVFCFTGLDGMPGTTGFSRNIFSEYSHNLQFYNFTTTHLSLSGRSKKA
jgi:hypothetical protein